jgi:CzcA family heavy metal efflux pump
MLNALVRGSLHYRVVVLIVAVVLLAVGVYSIHTAKYDVFPEFIPPMVVVQTEAPGFSPEDVEALVTRPIEYSLNGTAGIKTLRSNSIQGLSVITAIFDDDTKVLVDRQFIGEKLAQLAGRLPQGVRPPVMAPLTSSSGIVLRIGMTGRMTRPMELRTLADWTIRPRLLAVPGVANVTIFGGEVRQYQVQVHPERLLAYDLGLNEVLDAVRQANGLVGAGFIENTNQRITLTAQASLTSVEQLANVAVAVHENLPVRLGQVADVTIGPEPKFGDASILGVPAVELVVYKQFGANTLDVTQAVEATLGSLRDALPRDVELHPRLFRQATFIQRALRNINVALLEGGILVVVVLFLFLANTRTALISLTAIPLSLLAAVAALKLFGETINTLTLGGLAIAIGEVVDDAIIDVENIYRRLRENSASAQPRKALAVVLDASIEVRSAVVFATFIVVLVFVPIFFMYGIQGKLIAPLGYAYVLSILASLVVALTVTPAMSAVLLTGRPLPQHETRLLRWSKSFYESMLQPTLRHPWLVGLAALLLFAAAATTVPFLGGEFIPELNEGNYSIHMAGQPGTSMSESLRIGASVQKDLAALPVVDQVGQQVGRAELSEDIWGSNYSELHVAMKPLEGEEAEEARDQLRAVLVKYPGYYFSIKPFLTERIEEIITGTTAQVVIRIYGPDLDELDRLAAAVADVLRKVPGASDVVVEQQTGVPEFRLEVKPEQCTRYGLRPVQLLDVLHTVFQGSTVNQVYDQTRVFDMVVRLAPEASQNIESIRGILINTPAGGRVPLANLVSVMPTSGRSLITHEGTSRRALVQCNVRGRDVSGFLTEAQTAILGQIPQRNDYVFEFGGEAQAATAARNEILALSVAVLLGITVLLYAVFNSWRLLALVLSNLPFALVGGVAAVLLGGGIMSIGALVGFVTLFGISTRNSIMLVSHYQHLVEVEGHPWDRSLVIRGALERLGPILMTALVTALGLLPIALGGSSAGREVEQPMAVVILGGLITSTALNLLVLPTLIGRFGRFNNTTPVMANEEEAA